jgi:hypothetical protein
LAILGLLIGAFLRNFLLAVLSNPVDAARAYCVMRGWNERELAVRR